MWGTAYTHEGYIARVHPSRLKDRLDELLDENDSIWDQILVLMASTPKQDASGDDLEWPVSLTSAYREYRQQLEDNYRIITDIRNCLDVMAEHPDRVKED